MFLLFGGGGFRDYKDPVSSRPEPNALTVPERHGKVETISRTGQWGYLQQPGHQSPVGWEKWLKVGTSGEKWRKVEKLEKVAESEEKW